MNIAWIALIFGLMVGFCLGNMFQLLIKDYIIKNKNNGTNTTN
jgi:hypothetical protein